MFATEAALPKPRSAMATITGRDTRNSSGVVNGEPRDIAT